MLIESTGTPAQQATTDPFDDVPAPGDVAGYKGVTYRPGVEFDERADHELRGLLIEARIPRFLGNKILQASLDASRGRSDAERDLDAIRTETSLLATFGGPKGLLEAFQAGGQMFSHLPMERQKRLAELIGHFDDDPVILGSLLNLAKYRAEQKAKGGQ